MKNLEYSIRMLKFQSRRGIVLTLVIFFLAIISLYFYITYNQTYLLSRQYLLECQNLLNETVSRSLAEILVYKATIYTQDTHKTFVEAADENRDKAVQAFFEDLTSEVEISRNYLMSMIAPQIINSIGFYGQNIGAKNTLKGGYGIKDFKYLFDNVGSEEMVKFTVFSYFTLAWNLGAHSSPVRNEFTYTVKIVRASDEK